MRSSLPARFPKPGRSNRKSLLHRRPSRKFDRYAGRVQARRNRGLKNGSWKHNPQPRRSLAPLVPDQLVGAAVAVVDADVAAAGASKRLRKPLPPLPRKDLFPLFLWRVPKESFRTPERQKSQQ
jgi:hypothetical protein